MTIDFSKPQRQSALGIIVMAGHTTQRVARALIAPFIIAIVRADKTYFLYFGLSLLAILIIVIFFSYLSYRKFTFHLDQSKQEFIVNKGILSRTQLTIQLDKIQQVTINQTLLQKVVGIYGLKIDTAGSEGKEVSIKAIDKQVADRLREHLLDERSTDLMEDMTPLPLEKRIEAPFLKVSFATLLKVGLTSNYGSSIALVLVFFVSIIQHSAEILNALSMDDGQVEQLVKCAFTLVSVFILVLGLLIVLLIINLIRTFVKYYDFEITKHRNSLLISTGLFAKKNTLLSPDKVQMATYSQNYFQKKMNLLNVGLKQTGLGKTNDNEEMQHSNLEVPGCSAEERDQILTLILGRVPTNGTIYQPNFRFLNLPILFRVAIPLGLFLAAMWFVPEISVYLPFALLYSMVATLMIYIAYKRHRLIVSDETIIKRLGIWDIQHEVILPHKIQSITTFQYPWHKSVDVGHVDLHTAAGTIHFKFGNYTEIKKLVNYWLYQVESSDKDWM